MHSDPVYLCLRCGQLNFFQLNLMYYFNRKFLFSFGKGSLKNVMLVLGYKRKSTDGAQEQKGNINIMLCAEKLVV